MALSFLEKHMVALFGRHSKGKQIVSINCSNRPNRLTISRRQALALSGARGARIATQE